jgi:hypothetical protein
MHLPDLRKWLALGRRHRAPSDAVASPGGRLRLDEPGGSGRKQVDPEFAAHLAAIDALAGDSAWDRDRLGVADELWGEGCQWPGGTDEVMRCTVPFGLAPSSSLLLLGAGAAGPTVRIATELGIWVSGFEADPVLALVAERRIQKAGAVAKRSSVQALDLAKPVFKKNAFHSALSIEALRGEQPQMMIAAMRRAIKFGGQMAVIETVAPQPLDPGDPAVAAWCRLERRAPPPAGFDWITKPMSERGFDLRVNEDLTARQVRYAVTAWMRLVREMKTNRPPPRRAMAVVNEAELWFRRIDLMTTGKLKVMRWLSIHDGHTPAA